MICDGTKPICYSIQLLIDLHLDVRPIFIAVGFFGFLAVLEFSITEYINISQSQRGGSACWYKNQPSSEEIDFAATSSSTV